MCNFENEGYNSDCGRIIKKFDIYICDLGELDENSKGKDLKKTRPCVIVSSDDYNNPKSDSYMIAPLRTEHKESIGTEEDINSLIDKKLKVGRIYIPLEVCPGDFRFIDITETRKVSSRDIIRYSSSILNENIKKKINISLMTYLFSDMEIKEMYNNFMENTIEEEEEPNQIVEEIYEEDLNEDLIEDSKEETINENNNEECKTDDIKIPNGFSKIYDLVNNGRLTESEASDRMKMSQENFCCLVDKYKSMHNNQEKQAENKVKVKVRAKREPIVITEDFKDVYDNWRLGEINSSEAIILLNIEGSTDRTKYNRFYRMVNKYEKSIGLKK